MTGLEWAAENCFGREGLTSELPAVRWGQTSETADAPILPAVVADS